MIQKGSYLNIIDNSGIKTVQCIHVMGGYKKRYANFGDIVIVSIKNIRNSRAANQKKIKKGDIYKALIVRTKKNNIKYSSESIKFLENAAILYNIKKKTNRN